MKDRHIRVLRDASRHLRRRLSKDPARQGETATHTERRRDLERLSIRASVRLAAAEARRRRGPGDA